MTSQRISLARVDAATDTSSNGKVAGDFSMDGYTVVWAQGEIDVATAPGLLQVLSEAVRGPRCQVIVDLTDVTFMDSTGLNALAMARRKAEAGDGEIRLVGPRGFVLKLLQMTGFDQIFPVHPTIEESIGPAQHGVVVELPPAESRG